MLSNRPLLTSCVNEQENSSSAQSEKALKKLSHLEETTRLRPPQVSRLTLERAPRSTFRCRGIGSQNQKKNHKPRPAINAGSAIVGQLDCVQQPPVTLQEVPKPERSLLSSAPQSLQTRGIISRVIMRANMEEGRVDVSTKYVW